ncbi:MAG: efflux RND transporter periplasmic adaptor subunit, partial [Lacisediminimonas sp.]|nr:efflux RND transporter periplasmic adaptor subunit [Lacisediminimonas sp.]
MSAAKFPLRTVGLTLLGLLLLGGYVWQQWRGPEVAGYRLELRPLVQRVVASGEVDSQSISQIGSEITGVIAQRLVREGDRVQAGDLLLSLNDEEQQAKLREASAALRQLTDSSRPQAQATLAELNDRLAQLSRERQRREQLFKRQLLSVEQLEQARQVELIARLARDRAKLAATALAPGGSEEQVLRQRLAAAVANLAKTQIFAQTSGLVQSRDVEPGDLVQPGRVLLTLARADSQEIRLPLDEKSLAPVAVGQSATVIADAYPQQPLAARVSFMAPQVDAARGTLDVHLALLEPAAFLRQGMTVSVSIETGRRPQALVLPNEALRARQGERAEVLRVRDGVVEV